MMPVKQFLSELKQEFEPLYQVSEINTRNFFNSKPSKDTLIDHFKSRMCNERQNMIELSIKVSKLPITTKPNEARLLAKQTFDEAEHFRMVCEVLEHLSGDKVDLEDIYATHGTNRPDQGVNLISRYNAQDDELALALYQYLAEGRASRVWQTMADNVEDDFVASRYSKIARDERFHSEIGRMKLEEICITEEEQTRAKELARQWCWDLFEISCLSNVPPTEEAKSIMHKAYGEPPREIRYSM